MKKIFFIFILFVFIGVPQQGFADLSAPYNPVVFPPIGERSVRVQWNWSSECGNNICEVGEVGRGVGGGDECTTDCSIGETGTDPAKFVIDGGLKRDAKNARIVDCNSISNWFNIHEEPGQADRSKTIRGLDRGETYCWRIMAQANDTDDNSVVVLGEEFTTIISSGKAVCGNGNCESGEDPASCSQDCSSGGGGTQTVLENPISSQTLPELLNNVLNFLFSISIVILPIIILYGGFLMLTAAGDPTKISESRTILLWAVVAFAIIRLARGLPEVIRSLL